VSGNDARERDIQRAIDHQIQLDKWDHHIRLFGLGLVGFALIAGFYFFNEDKLIAGGAFVAAPVLSSLVNIVTTKIRDRTPSPSPALDPAGG
jgi:hypothetical protein